MSAYLFTPLFCPNRPHPDGSDCGLCGSPPIIERGPEPITVWVCVDCYVTGNGYEIEGEQPATEPWHITDQGLYEIVDDGGDEDGEGEQTFSNQPCQGCGSTLAGSRHRFALFPRRAS